MVIPCITYILFNLYCYRVPFVSDLQNILLALNATLKTYFSESLRKDVCAYMCVCGGGGMGSLVGDEGTPIATPGT